MPPKKGWWDSDMIVKLSIWLVPAQDGRAARWDGSIKTNNGETFRLTNLTAKDVTHMIPDELSED